MRTMNRIAPARSLAVGIALIALALAVQPAAAQQQTGRLVMNVLAADNALQNRPVMVSAIVGGTIADQKEVLLDRAPNTAGVVLQRVPAGTCDVRVEGDGIVTEVKRGVQIFAGRDAELKAVVRPGQGVHTVEYATGGLSREEVAARLAGLEATTAAIRKTVDQLAADSAARARSN